MCEHKSFSWKELRKWEGGNVIVDLHKLFLIEYPPSYTCINIYASNKKASKQTNPKAKQINQPTQTKTPTKKTTTKKKEAKAKMF